jgi:lincosamide nucleotidyltransferase A/C/D/E
VLRATLFSRGFFDVPTGDHSDWNYVMGNADGKNIDFHVIEMAEGGRGIYGPPEHGVFFPAESLKAIGRIDGRHVRCLSAKFQVHSHTGYELKPKDFADIGALHRKFGIPLPPEYRDLLPDRLDPG